MPFEKRMNVKKRRRFRRRPGLNKRALRTVSHMIEKKIEEAPEKKYYDTYFNGNVISTTQTDQSLTDVSGGTGSNQRIGHDIDLISIQFKLAFTVADSTNIIRMVLYQWLDDPIDLTNVPFPEYTQLFEYGVTTGITVTSQLFSPLIITGRAGSFKILLDRYIVLDTTSSPVEVVEGFINKKFRKKVHFDTGATYGPNHVNIMLISDSAAITHPTVDGYMRVRYTDS